MIGKDYLHQSNFREPIAATVTVIAESKLILLLYQMVILFTFVTIPITILWIVAINANELIDGLDGLAAGIFYRHSYHLLCDGLDVIR